MTVTVSVVVPTGCRPGGLPAALRSIAEQDIPGTEIIVVNDGAGDRVAAALPLGVPGVTVRLVSFAAARGQAPARNTGLGLARGRYVAFLDDDDVYLPGHLARSIETLERAGADLVYSDSIVIPASVVAGDPGEAARPGRVTAASLPGGSEPDEEPCRYDFPYDPEMLAVANYVPTSAVVCRNPAVHGSASWFRFDPELRRLVDWSLWLRLVHDRGWAFARIPADGVVRRRAPEDASLSGRADAHLAAVVRYEDAYRTVAARWPVRPGSRIARFRTRILQMCEISQLLVSTGQPLVPFAYERALRVVYEGFTGRLDEERVGPCLEAALTGDPEIADADHTWNSSTIPGI